jgi:hypothetical protein
MKSIVLLLSLPLFFLTAQQDDSWKVYTDSTLVRIDITIDPAKLQWIYDNPKSDSEHLASIRFSNGLLDESVDSIGFRLRGNTSRDAKKKSFKVSFNSFIKGRKFHGVEKLNLNGEHNDPSIIRSKLTFDLYQDMGIIASRANHARVTINGKYYGLYVSVEHVDEEFLKKKFADDGGNLWKCLYPADLTYLGADPNLYKNVNHNPGRAYELSTNEAKDDYSALARMIGIINNTPAGSLADSVEAVLDIASVLQYFAVNTLVGSWDDYRSLMNNFYLYHDPSGKKIIMIPYDYDNTFGVDWFNTNWASANPYNYPKAVAGPRPLWEKLIANPEYRNLYTHFLRFYRDHTYALPLWEDRLQRVKDTITIAALDDTYRTLDYGFTFPDFQNSYTSGSYSKQHVKKGIRQFVNERNTSLPGQLNNVSSGPMVYRIATYPQRPSSSDSVTVTAACFAAAGLKNVWLQYIPYGSASAHIIPMTRTPVPGTKRVEEHDRWTGVIPPLNTVASGSFRIFVQDSLDHAQLFPRRDSVRIITSQTGAASVIVNEFMADNTSIADPAGQYDDWIELYNPTAQPVMMTGKYLTDKATSLTKWKFTQPGLIIPPGGYLMVWCDEEPLQSGVHAGIKLSAGGEFIAVTDSDGVTVLDSLSFGPQRTNISFGRSPNGSAAWGAMDPTPLAANSAIMNAVAHNIVPNRFDMSVFPNPFNPVTTFRFTLPGSAGDGNVLLELYTILGEKAATLVNERRSHGTYAVQWNASRFASGTYIAKLQSGAQVRYIKILLLK